MAKNNCRKGFVEIPQMTLNALKGLLFDNEGVDLSSIINDLKPNENDELTTINVALVYKGLTPKVDETTRYKKDWKRLYRYEYVGLSLILGIVKVKVSCSYFNESNNTFGVWEEDNDIQMRGLDEWLEMSTDIQTTKSEIIEQYGKKETTDKTL